MAAYDPKAKARADALAKQKWYNDREDKLASQLAEGKYPSIKPEEHGYIPEQFFQHAKVQAKFDEMKKNESVDPSNKQRIPEKYPFYRPKYMEKYLNSLAIDSKLPLGSYSIGTGEDQKNAVFFDSIPKFTIEKNKFKIHLMFNVKYMEEVLPVLFHELINKGFPVTFKLLSFNPVTSIINRAGIPNPMFYDVNITNYRYGTNSAKKAEYGRLAESFIYSPTEIKKYPVTAHFTDRFAASKKGYPASETTSTFILDGTTKKGKVIKERYDMETVFDPVIVFYTNDKDPHYTQRLLQELLTIFPDETTSKWVLPNFYPRGNVKINNMIYVANGDFGRKYNTNLQCKFNFSGPGPICSAGPNVPLLDIPTEYQTIQDSCESLDTPDNCNAANRLPLAVSNHKLCKWESEKCKPQKTYGQHLLLKDNPLDPRNPEYDAQAQDYDSLEQLYDALGQRAVLERFKEGAANASLPVNYNGGRRKKRRNTKKARRTRRRSSRKN